MRAEDVRKFNVMDGMILVAATALGLWAGRANMDLRSKLYLEGSSFAESAVITIRFVALSWTMAILILRFRAPRPRWRRLWRQPGLAACSAVLLGSFFGGMSMFDWFLRLWKPLPKPSHIQYSDFNIFNLTNLVSWPPYFAQGVMTAWMILALSGHWRSEASWIDRAGRVLGLFWIAAAFLFDVRIVLM